ncbi:MAG: hypothetical protein KTR31_21365 [Myxococcales bacterium]|nr:hypothetical protein [Myxococcales bacterium]
MSRCSIIAWMALGCGGGSAADDVSGTWQGSCDVFAQGVEEPEHYELDYVVRGQRDGTLTGTAVVLAPFLLEPIAGNLAGTHGGGEASVVATLGDQTLGFELTLAGALQGDTLEGSCDTETASGTGQLTRTSAELPEDDAS